MPVFWGGGFGRQTRRGGSMGCGPGCLTSFIVCTILFILIIFLITYAATESRVTKSTVERVPLPKGAVTETAYFTDELGWINNPSKLTAGMKNFYAKTGVQPHLYITDNINGSQSPTDAIAEEFAYELYDELFSDEAHLLLIFFENDNFYRTWYMAGRQAKSVIDSEAGEILLDFIDRYYYDSLSDEEYFSKAFSEAGERIMKVTVSPWIGVFIVFGVLAIVLLLFVFWSKRKKQKNLEAEQTEKILSTPLETFGGEAEALAGKYEDEEKNKP